MKGEKSIALIGLDGSHAIEFSSRIQAPDCSKAKHVDGLRITSCLRFPSSFVDSEVLAERTVQLEKWNIKVTDDFDSAVSDAEAFLISINDPSKHVDYFERCAGIGKPIFPGETTISDCYPS